jgi:hypothetical protein
MPKKIKSVRPASPTPWSGRIDEMERSRPGGPLMGALLSCANERADSVAELAAGLDVTPGYLNQLRSGVRKVSTISDVFSQACAAYLAVSRGQVLMLAGRVTPADFFPVGDSYEQDVTRALGFVCEDPAWAPLITGELRKSGLDSRYAIVRLYEVATNTCLMQHRINPTKSDGSAADVAEVDTRF